MRHPLRAVIPPVQSQHIKQHKKVTNHTNTETSTLQNSTCCFPHASHHFQTADCLRPEENLQPLVQGSSQFLHGFHRFSTGFGVVRPRDLIFICFVSLEKQYLPSLSQISAGRRLSAFYFASLWLHDRSLPCPSSCICLRSFNHTEARGFLRSYGQGSWHLVPNFLCHRVELRSARGISFFPRDPAIIITESLLIPKFHQSCRVCSGSTFSFVLGSQGRTFFVFKQRPLPVIWQFFPHLVIPAGQALLVLLFSCLRGDTHASAL